MSNAREVAVSKVCNFDQTATGEGTDTRSGHEVCHVDNWQHAKVAVSRLPPPRRAIPSSKEPEPLARVY